MDEGKEGGRHNFENSMNSNSLEVNRWSVGRPESPTNISSLCYAEGVASRKTKCGREYRRISSEVCLCCLWQGWRDGGGVEEESKSSISSLGFVGPHLTGPRRKSPSATRYISLEVFTESSRAIINSDGCLSEGVIT